MTSGQAVMAMNTFTFFPPLIDQNANPDYFDQIGFFPNPKGPTGLQGTALGGQAISVNAYISLERQEAAKAFIKWFGQEEVQAKWGELGGGTSNISVLKSDQFLNAKPYNPAFAASMAFVKDFWNIPIYDQLFVVVQGELVKFVVDGNGTAQETMDTIATEQEKILKENGYIQ
jgi:multiple sugar transport system substrate-binding protein